MEHRVRQMRTAFISSGPPVEPSKEGFIEEFYRRRHIRYPLRVPVEYRKIPANGKEETIKTKSRDISEGGAFVFTRALPALGTNMELVMRLPNTQAGATPLVLEMRGEVIRLEMPSGRENQWGFAVSARRTVFRTPS